MMLCLLLCSICSMSHNHVGCVADDRQRHGDTRACLTNTLRDAELILDFEVILQFRSGSISLFLQFNICCQQHWIYWHVLDRKGPTTGYEPKYLHPSALSAQQVPREFVLWVTHQLKWECPNSKVLQVQMHPSFESVLFVNA